MRLALLDTMREFDFERELQTCSECHLSAKSAFATPRGDSHETHTNVTRREFQLHSRGRLLKESPAPKQLNRKHATQPEVEPVSEHHVDIGTLDMDDKFANHYQVLDLPIYATRHQIRKAYQRRLNELERTSAAHSALGSNKPLIEHLPVVASSDSLRVFLEDEILKSWHSIDAVVATRRKPPTQQGETWHRARPASQAIARRNELNDAYYILSHPVMKKVYDTEHEQHLKPYEGRRMKNRVCGQASKAMAVRQAKNWLASLEHGHEKGTKFVEIRFNRVEDMERYGRYDKGTIASSMMCGEVIAAFVDTMEL